MGLNDCKTWLKDPNKSWFKLWKFIFSMIRALLLLAFFILALYLLIQNRNFLFPQIAFICLLIINWRFILSLVLIILIIIIKIIQLISLCLCIGLITNGCWEPVIKLFKSVLVGLNWSQLDWPCFHNLKYYIYYLDALHYLVYFIAVFVIFCIEYFARNTNSTLLIVFIINLAPLFGHIFIEVLRIVQAKRVEQTIRDIFNSDVAFSEKARAMISEDQMGSSTCVHLADCTLVDSHHRALSHPKEIFTKTFKDIPFNKRRVNMTIGFHQTTIEASKSILATGFKPSKSGMLGPGIYFATNYDATEFKRNQSTEGGAIFCAVLDMGRVREIVDKSDSLDYSNQFNSKYLRHGAGDAYDEFVVYNESQVVEYTIIVEQAAIDSYRAKNKRTFDFI